MCEVVNGEMRSGSGTAEERTNSRYFDTALLIEHQINDARAWYGHPSQQQEKGAANRESKEKKAFVAQ
jgi:hypothetical protein